PGHIGPSHPESLVPRAEARVGDREAHPTDLEGTTAGPTGVAVSRVVPARTAGGGQNGLGGHPNRTPSPVLCVDRRGAETSRGRAGELEPFVDRHQPRRENDVGRSHALGGRTDFTAAVFIQARPRRTGARRRITISPRSTDP